MCSYVMRVTGAASPSALVRTMRSSSRRCARPMSALRRRRSALCAAPRTVAPRPTRVDPAQSSPLLFADSFASDSWRAGARRDASRSSTHARRPIRRVTPAWSICSSAWLRRPSSGATPGRSPSPDAHPRLGSARPRAPHKTAERARTTSPSPASKPRRRHPPLRRGIARGARRSGTNGWRRPAACRRRRARPGAHRFER
jgi:hypothetical protein